MRYLIYCFILAFLYGTSGKAAENQEAIVPLLNHAELELYSDSTSSQNWAAYGLVMLIRGWPRWCEYSLERAERCEAPSPIMYRTLATYRWLQGDTRQAVETLVNHSSDTYSKILLALYHQESGDLTASENLILDIHSQSSQQAGLLSLLNARQLRLSGDMLHAFSILDSSLAADSIPDPLKRIMKLELLLYHETDVLDLNLMDCVEADIALTGGVYLNPLLSRIDALISDPDVLLIKSRILSILDRHREAEELIPSCRDSLISQDVALWHIDLLIHLDKLNEAMDEVSVLIGRDSTNSRALQRQGVLLMRGQRYSEAFLEMQRAWEKTGSPGCIAMQGLAAEFAGHTKLAFETYTSLVSSNPDSIILINRCRNHVQNINPQELLDSEGNESFTDRRFSRLAGNVSLSYYDNTGEYKNRSFSVNSNISYRYGLYGSNVTATGRYSLNRWPESESDYISIMTSLSARNYSTSRLFQQFLLDWEMRDYTTDRNRFEVTGGMGYRFDPFSALQCTGYLGFGRSVEKLDSETTDHWITVPELSLRLRGSSFLSVIPFIELSGETAYNLDKSSGYELTLSAIIDLVSNGFYSFSLGYDATQSFQPETDYYYINRCTYIMLTLRFD